MSGRHSFFIASTWVLLPTWHSFAWEVCSLHLCMSTYAHTCVRTGIGNRIAHASVDPYKKANTSATSHETAQQQKRTQQQQPTQTQRLQHQQKQQQQQRQTQRPTHKRNAKAKATTKAKAKVTTGAKATANATANVDSNFLSSTAPFSTRRKVWNQNRALCRIACSYVLRVGMCVYSCSSSMDVTRCFCIHCFRPSWLKLWQSIALLPSNIFRCPCIKNSSDARCARDAPSSWPSPAPSCPRISPS